MTQFLRWGLAAAAVLVVFSGARGRERPEILIADFEGRDYGTWKVEGEAFGRGPARGTLPRQMAVSGFEGKGLVNSYFKGDRSTGRLTSPPLKIERPYISFLIGGGMHPGQTCINLLVDGRVVRTATGPNDRPGGSERLDWQSWDVTDLAGRSAVIEIVDRATGGWGHINIDQIVQGDRRRGAALVDQKRELVLDKRYLNLPVKNGAPKRRITLAIDGRTVREFEIELADAEPDFWVFLDVSSYRGKRAVLNVDRLPEDSRGLAAVELSDTMRDAEDLYLEKYRPQFHFSTRRGWINDPNGLVFHEGEYHLYYQHNPYGWRSAQKHWGHAVSTDLVHWQELPCAIYPFRYGDWVYSGSAVIDRDNTAGLKQGAEDVLAAFFTSTGRGECLAYSLDRGRTFTDYPGNPLVVHKGRDPKVIWYAPGRHWVMAVYDDLDGSRGIAFYTSPDLKTWQRQSRIEGYYECPELFEMAVDGDPRNTRWVVYAADGAYSVGRFDGRQFTAESGKHRYNWGNCFYASQTFNNIPPADGRRIQIAWGRIGHPSMPFNQMMDFPVELSLRSTDEGPRLLAVPVRELALLRGKRHAWTEQPLRPGDNPLAGMEGDLFEIRAEFAPGTAAQLGLTIRGTPVVYDVRSRQLSCLNREAPLVPAAGRIRLHVLVDRTSIEIFANDGRVYMPMGVIFEDQQRSWEVFAHGGEARLLSLEVFELRSIWGK